MKQKTLKTYIEALSNDRLLLKLHEGGKTSKDYLITDIKQDSRQVSEGCIFVA